MNPVGYRPGVLKLGHVHQQGRRPVAGEDEGGVAVRAPAPRLVRDERLVGVEACEVIDVRVVVLGGATTRPRDDGGEAALPSESERGPLARVVFGALDAYGSSRRHGVRRSPIGGLAKVGRDRAYQGLRPVVAFDDLLEDGAGDHTLEAPDDDAGVRDVVCVALVGARATVESLQDLAEAVETPLHVLFLLEGDLDDGVDA